MSTPTLLALASAAALSLAPSAALQDEPPAERVPSSTGAVAAPVETFETLTRKTRDGIPMTADLYTVRAFDAAEGASAGAIAGAAEGAAEPREPWGIVIGLHQDRASRGEFRGVAPELNRLGLDVLAVDLRAGGRRFMVDNGTAASFTAQTGTVAKPKEAYDDVASAVKWARELRPDRPLILFGSASSAALALVYAAREEDSVAAVFAFSPGEYLDGWSVQEAAGKLRVPIYATCGPGSKESTWAGVAIALVDKQNLTTFFPTRDVRSLHGVQTLLAGDEANREQQWAPVRRVLESVRSASAR